MKRSTPANTPDATKTPQERSKERVSGILERSQDYAKNQGLDQTELNRLLADES